MPCTECKYWYGYSYVRVIKKIPVIYLLQASFGIFSAFECHCKKKKKYIELVKIDTTVFED